MSDVDMDFNRDQDVPPDKPVPAGFYEGVVVGVQFHTQGADDQPYPDCQIARVTYRLTSEDSELNGKRVQPFPIPVRGHKDSWKWFDWCTRMGYDTKQPFRFAAEDVDGVPVSLRFGPPRSGKVGSKSEGKLFDNLEEMQRLR